MVTHKSKEIKIIPIIIIIINKNNVYHWKGEKQSQEKLNDNNPVNVFFLLLLVVEK